MSELDNPETVRAALAILIAADLYDAIANLGYPVGMGQAPNIETCRKAAERIVDRIKDKALDLLAERKAAAGGAE